MLAGVVVEPAVGKVFAVVGSSSDRGVVEKVAERSLLAAAVVVEGQRRNPHPFVVHSRCSSSPLHLLLLSLDQAQKGY